MMKATTLPSQLVSGSVSFDFAKACSSLETARLAVPRPEHAFVADLLLYFPLMDVSEKSVQGGLQQQTVRQSLGPPL